MLRWTVTVLLVFPVTDPAFAQSRGEWYWRSPERPAYYGPAYRDGPPPDYRLRSYPYERDLRRYWLDEDEPPRYRSDLERRRWEDEDPRARVPDRGLGPAIVDGGPRPSVRPIPPTQIAFGSSYLPGSIVIDTTGRKLYLVQSPISALVYPISVGREGFSWVGTEMISRIADWPDWHPPAEMRQRDPRLPEKMTGGVRNPLGAKALYLGNTLYRIHGTDDARTIGQATSSGCFRMTNGHVVDLAHRVDVGAKVIVVNRLPSSVARSSH
jgi:lipoprotein-anchoring transpeptidase ErfK/SrfK